MAKPIFIVKLPSGSGSLIVNKVQNDIIHIMINNRVIFFKFDCIEIVSKSIKTDGTEA